eukprot:CAMPEP_0197534738 /NCGR_PEP_ID=MMETSP1318-20131121/48150_1 /TAXON_ID=552666 /ORGANISM="Partenskyella glossopodia, Strain RCC365" /LENGTH=344 /DNA_ID=CAMNT_0043092113 /DNA_START=122 /DNA_END=1156 /DNA_ORIENTATION=+
MVTTFAGGKMYRGRTLDGTGTNITFDNPAGITFNPKNMHLIVSDSNCHQIRGITPDGQSYNITGVSHQKGVLIDGSLSTAKWFFPNSVAVGPSGAVYVTQPTHDIIRKIDLDKGEVTTIVGSPNERGSYDGEALKATLAQPRALAVDSSENLYWIDYRTRKIRMFNSSTQTTHFVAGDNKKLPDGGIDGYPEEATFCFPEGIAVDKHRNIIIADTMTQKLRVISSEDKDVYSSCGRDIPETPFSEELDIDDSNPDGKGRNAYLDSPYGVAIAPDGSLFITDKEWNRIRKVDSNYCPQNYAPLPKGGKVTYIPHERPTDKDSMIAHLDRLALHPARDDYIDPTMG